MKKITLAIAGIAALLVGSMSSGFAQSAPTPVVGTASASASSWVAGAQAG